MPATELDSPPRLLILDPDERRISEYTQTLAREGWEVDYARSFAEGLELATRTRYNLAVMDLMLPDMVATEGWRHLKDRNPDMFAIITTSSLSLYSSVNAFEPGVIGYLLKPLHLSAISSFANQALEHQRVASKAQRLQVQFQGLSELLSRLSPSMDALEMLDSMMMQFHAMLQPDWVMVYLLGEDGLSWTHHTVHGILSGESGWTEPDSKCMEQMMTDCLKSQRAVVLGREFSSGSEKLAQIRTPSGFGAVLIAPLQVGSQAYGALAAVNRNATESSFSTGEFELVVTLGRVIALTLDNLRLAKQIRVKSIHARIPNMYSRAYLDNMIGLQVANKKRYARPFSLILLQWTGLRQTSEGHVENRIMKAVDDVNRMVQQRVRGSDVVACLSDEQYAVLMPETDDSGARRVGERLANAIKERLSDELVYSPPKVRIKAITPPDGRGETLDEILQMADIANSKTPMDPLGPSPEWLA